MNAQSPRRSRRIWLVLPVAAAVIALLVGFKLTRSPVAYQLPADEVRRAPLFQLYDDQSRIVRLARYIGRHKLLVVFFDASAGAQNNPLLKSVGDGFARLEQTGAIVLGVSTATPFAQFGTPADPAARRRTSNLPFPLLSDISQEVHRSWGAFEASSDRPREAVVVVDRAGMIRKLHPGPDRLGTVDEWVAQLENAP